VLRLQPIDEIHLFSGNMHDNVPHGDIRYIWMFGGVAVVILLLACINFVNLPTARSANRAKEVGLRKVVGSHRSMLIRQFLSESILYSIISFALAVGMVTLFMPYFRNLAGKNIEVPWTNLWFVSTL